MISRKLSLAFIIFAVFITAVYFRYSIVFEVDRPAYSYDEEVFNGKPVAFGPRPRWLIAKPSYHNFFYDGSEWPFHWFRAYCEKWIAAHHFAKPHAWRELNKTEQAAKFNKTFNVQ